MNDKEKLMELIEQLPEDKFPEAIALLANLIKKQNAVEEIPDPLTTFMGVVVSSLTNTIYDLSVDAKRKEEKVMANRLEAYRKKISEGWEVYRNNTTI